MTSKKTVLISVCFVIFMFGFAFALIPLYNTFCSVLGINGKVQQAKNIPAGFIDKSRLVTLEIITHNNSSVPWDFYPLTHKIKLHPGEIKRFEVYAKNNSSKKMIVQAIPSVAPGLAAKYLKKTECFCFTQQALGPKESLNMPVLLHIDPELPKSITTVTLAYTLFDVTDRLGVPVPKDHPGGFIS